MTQKLFLFILIVLCTGKSYGARTLQEVRQAVLNVLNGETPRVNQKSLKQLFQSYTDKLGNLYLEDILLLFALEELINDNSLHVQLTSHGDIYSLHQAGSQKPAFLFNQNWCRKIYLLAKKVSFQEPFFPLKTIYYYTRLNQKYRGLIAEAIERKFYLNNVNISTFLGVDKDVDGTIDKNSLGRFFCTSIQLTSEQNRFLIISDREPYISSMSELLKAYQIIQTVEESIIIHENYRLLQKINGYRGFGPDFWKAVHQLSRESS